MRFFVLICNNLSTICICGWVRPGVVLESLEKKNSVLLPPRMESQVLSFLGRSLVAIWTALSRLTTNDKSVGKRSSYVGFYRYVLLRASIIPYTVNDFF